MENWTADCSDEGKDTLGVRGRATITNQALVDREGSLYYYLPLTPRVSLPPPLQSAVQFSMSMQ